GQWPCASWPDGGFLMITNIPPIGFLLDIPFGVLMWTSLLQFLLMAVLAENSRVMPLQMVRGLNAPLHALLQLAKPRIIEGRLIPLYAAFVLFILRYYLLPELLDYDIWNFYQMPLEKLLIEAKADLGL
ncbi:MAG: hypothetical protein VW835_07800, partial [Rickettsiales bacterium]